jgi:hypothetical protein
MTRLARVLSWIVGVTGVVAALWYLHDPPWAGDITSGLRHWTSDRRGTSYRWTNGHASFFVPADVSVMTLPVRSGIPRPDGRPVCVSVSVDDHWLLTQRLGDDPERWVGITVWMPAGRPARRFRRLDIRVDSVIPEFNLGVQLGEPVFRRTSRGASWGGQPVQSGVSAEPVEEGRSAACPQSGAGEVTERP